MKHPITQAHIGYDFTELDKRRIYHPPRWQRIRNLPEAERQPFTAWLAHQTRPWFDNEPDDQQDGYYEHDYKRWKAQQKKP